MLWLGVIVLIGASVVWFLRNKEKAKAAADRALTVPTSVKDKLPSAVAGAVQSAEDKAQASVNQAIDKA